MSISTYSLRRRLEESNLGIKKSKHCGPVVILAPHPSIINMEMKGKEPLLFLLCLLCSASPVDLEEKRVCFGVMGYTLLSSIYE